jgi:hypothetical protein
LNANGRMWPVAIASGLLLVVVVNVAFIWVAVRTAPQIEPSYEHATVR